MIKSTFNFTPDGKEVNYSSGDNGESAFDGIAGGNEKGERRWFADLNIEEWGGDIASNLQVYDGGTTDPTNAGVVFTGFSINVNNSGSAFLQCRTIVHRDVLRLSKKNKAQGRLTIQIKNFNNGQTLDAASDSFFPNISVTSGEFEIKCNNRNDYMFEEAHLPEEEIYIPFCFCGPFCNNEELKLTFAEFKGGNVVIPYQPKKIQ